jgi:hypothetical protein
MKKAEYQDLIAQITVTETANRGDHYFTAMCPLCGRTETADVLSSVAVARTVAKGKVVTHIHLGHQIKEDEE